MDQPTSSRLWEADDQLSRVVSHLYWVQQAPDAAPLTQQLVPNYEMMLVINLGPPLMGSIGDQPLTIGRTGLLGPLKRLLQYDLLPTTELFALNFTLDGFYRLLGRSLSQLRTDNWLDTDILLDNSLFDVLWQQLMSASDPDDRAHQIFNFVLYQLTPTEAIAKPLLDTIPYFRQPSVDPVKAVAQAHRVSPRLIQQRFQHYLGYSAKEMTRFIRFRNVLYALVHRSTPVDWLDVVQHFGYHDQSHLIRDFHYYLGMTPRQFLRQAASGGICIAQPGKFY